MLLREHRPWRERGFTKLHIGMDIQELASHLSWLLPLSQVRVDDCDGLVAEAGSHSGAFPIPADLKDAAGPSEGAHEGAPLDGPDVELLVEGSAGQPQAVRAEGDRIHRMRVLDECADACPSFYLP